VTALRLPGRGRPRRTAAGDKETRERRGLAAREAAAARVPMAAGARNDGRHRNGAPRSASAVRVPMAAGVRGHTGAPDVGQEEPDLTQETGPGRLLASPGSGDRPREREHCREDESGDSQAEIETRHGVPFGEAAPGRGASMAPPGASPGVCSSGRAEKSAFVYAGLKPERMGDLR
jgi:hypothetical protein